MKEYGSDFHFLNFPCVAGGKTLFDYYPNAVFLADGRQAIESLINYYKWKRIWIPEYFCWEIIAYILLHCEIEVKTYQDNPVVKDHHFVGHLPFQEGDVLLWMNYFGLREIKRINVPIPVIEDHSHNIFSEWVWKSKAEFCIASLRKTLPLAEGGILWSNSKDLSELGSTIKETLLNEKVARTRWQAMAEKALYLSQDNEASIPDLKDSYREKFLRTEQCFGSLPVSRISSLDRQVLEKIDIKDWSERRNRNWKIVVKQLSFLLKKNGIRLLVPESESLIPFSLLLLFPDKMKRERFRKGLISKSIYPAVLWEIPETCSRESRIVSDGILSIHCDARYSADEIGEMGCQIYTLLKSFEE